MQGSMSQATRAINMGHIGVMVVSADHKQGQMTVREVNLAAKVIGEGRPLIVALNKLDLVEDSKRSQARLVLTKLLAQWHVAACSFRCLRLLVPV